jgi:uncharacterized membrane protein
MDVFRIIVIIWLVISAVRFLSADIRGVRAVNIEKKAEDAGAPLDQDLVGQANMMNSKAFTWSLISTIAATIVLIVIR